jgi:hypothetical protein
VAPVLGNPVNAGYSVLTTAGTYTLNPGPGSPAQGVGVGIPGVYYGAYVTTFGTSPVFSVYDIQPVRGSVATATNLLHNGTGTAANQSFQPLPGGLPGIRYTGALVVVVTGTANALNVLWD